MIFRPNVHKGFLTRKLYTICPNSYAHRPLYSSNSNHNRGINAHGFIDFFDLLLQHCIICVNDGFSVERPVKQIHTQIVITSSGFSAFLSARLVSAYAKPSLLSDARKVFDRSPGNCFFSSIFWNSMLRAYVSDFRYESGVELYGQMRELNVHPDGFGFPLIIRACAMMADVRLCRIVHCHVVRLGYGSNLHVSNELVGMYGEIGWTQVALQVFDQMPLKSCVSWNIMMSSLAKSCDCDGAFELFCRMENEGWEPNSVTWTSLISSFAKCRLHDKTWEFYVLMKRRGVDATAESIAVVISGCHEMPVKGEIMHGNVITAGFGKFMFVRNALISMYSRNADIRKAEDLFSELEKKSIVSWNALISAYAQSNLCNEAYSSFLRLKNSDEDPSLHPNVVSWTAVLDGFASNGRHKETLEIFQHMQFANVQANAITVASVLSVCAELSALSLGKEIHAHTVRVWMNGEMLVANGLINMYMKCGSLWTGHSIFKGMIVRDVNSWNIMITGYGIHGVGDDALKCFHQMVNAGCAPDKVTFVAVLSACSHSGLVAEGRDLFNRMIVEFQIEPQVEHYACMVDLFGRAGLLQEASGILKSMPMEPNAPVWGALLNSCKMHNNMSVAEETAVRIFGLDSEVTGSYMLLSNIYAESGKWGDAANVRLSAKTRGLKKAPGHSLIEVNKRLHSFSAGMASDGDMKEVHRMLQELNLQTMVEGHASEGLFEQNCFGVVSYSLGFF